MRCEMGNVVNSINDEKHFGSTVLLRLIIKEKKLKV